MASYLELLFVILAWISGALAICPLAGMESAGRIPSEYIILLKQNLQSDTKTTLIGMQTFASSVGQLDVVRTYEFAHFRAAFIRAEESVIQHLRHHGDADIIEANQYVYLQSNDVEAEKDTGSCVSQNTGSKLWGLSRLSSLDQPTYNSAHYRHNQDGGQEVYAYVMDSGVNVQHEDFEGRASFGMVATDFEDEGHDDLNGHGTHVAGTIASKTYGVAKKANIISVKVYGKEGIFTTVSMVEGMTWLCNDFQQKNQDSKNKAFGVANLSLGTYNISYLFDAAVVGCSDTYGLTFVVAAGNEATDACYTSPARVRTAITVGATDIDDKVASFSNHGPCVDIFAPGQDILSTWIGNSTATTQLDGTSMATPHVTGVVAKYLSSLKEPVSPQQIKAWVLDTSLKNKISISRSEEAIASPNRLLHMRCSYVPDVGTDMMEVTVILVSIIMVFVVVMCGALGFVLYRGLRS